MMDLVLSRSTGTLMMSTVFGVSDFQDLLRENLRERARERDTMSQRQLEVHDFKTELSELPGPNFFTSAFYNSFSKMEITHLDERVLNKKSNLLILFLIIHVSKNSASQDYRHMIGERANVTLTVLGKNMLNYYIKMFSLK